MAIEKPESDYFCILPWMHMHTWANGATFPCCLAAPGMPVGNTNDSSFLEIWNSEGMRNLRLNMINDMPSRICRRCYEHEKAGVESLRMSKNRDYKHKLERIRLTKEDGSLDEVHMSYLDIRFSNICNMRCRTCGPVFSSLWHSDAVGMGIIEPEAPRIYRAKKDINELWNEVVHWLDDIEQIYFAGGEPLIMDEHYKILEHLISIGKTDIEIGYNTNFSKLTYKNKDVVELWKHFSNVKVGASLDAMGDRAECMRKGTNWKEIEKNRLRLLEEVPHVEFKISSTVSVFNAQHILDFYSEWLDKGWVEVNHIDTNLLLEPVYQRAQILPKDIKTKIQANIDDFLEKYNVKEVDVHGRAYAGLTGLQNFLNEDFTNEIPEFLKWSKKLDDASGDNLFESIPELQILKEQ
jgi:sulfatase maturation enzyme AslB (radical SAM superfamily)